MACPLNCLAVMSLRQQSSKISRALRRGARGTITLSLVALFAAFGVGCILDNEGAPDAAVFEASDAGPRPGFRDAGCSGGTSGTSGTNCLGDGGAGVTADAVVADAEPPPDAEPPCDLITFSYVDAGAQSVWVTGDFTSWATTLAEGAWQLTGDGAGNWTRTEQVGPGRHSYKLVINGTDWIADPSNPTTEPDGFGGQNSVIVVCAGG